MTGTGLDSILLELLKGTGVSGVLTSIALVYLGIQLSYLQKSMNSWIPKLEDLIGRVIRVEERLRGMDDKE